MRTVVVIQARTGSTRLPGKVLADLDGQPMIARVVDRAGRIDGADEVVVALPDLPEDDELGVLVQALGVRSVRGPSDDVLERYARAIDATGADAVLRVTADCPLLSPKISGRVLGAFAQGEIDYASNTLERTFPRGLDTEVVAADVLRAASREAEEPAEREHVTPFVWRRPDRFRLLSVRGEPDRSDLRWTVDTAADLAFARAVYRELGPGPFEMDEILALLERRPELGALNATVAQKPID